MGRLVLSIASVAAQALAGSLVKADAAAECPRMGEPCIDDALRSAVIQGLITRVATIDVAFGAPATA